VAHVTFIHGIDSKPEPQVLFAQWRALVGLGSVIAYDVLEAVGGARRVDALMTVGSPLGSSEVHDRLSPPWSRDDGWPSHRLCDEPWSNLYDPLDSVCGGFDRRTAGDFVRAGASRATDMSVTNVGSRRHAIANYLGQNRLRDLLWEPIE
jgi:hypothetical protein